MSEILDVDLLAFERGSGEQRRAVVDGVRRSLETGFVLTRHDLSEDMLDTAYGMLVEFFTSPPDEKQRWVAPGANGQTGLHRTARRDGGIERAPRLEGDAQLGDADPGRASVEAQVPDGVPRPAAARGDRAGHHQGALRVPRHHRRSPAALPARHRRGHRLPRDVLRRHGRRRTDAHPGDPLPTDDGVAGGRRRLRVGRPARRHQPDHRPAAGDGTGPAGARRRASGSTPSHPRARSSSTPGSCSSGSPTGRSRSAGIASSPLRAIDGERYSVVQFCHPRPWTVLAPVPSCCTPEQPQRFAAISAADALDEVLYEINLVEDARRV